LLNSTRKTLEKQICNKQQGQPNKLAALLFCLLTFFTKVCAVDTLVTNAVYFLEMVNNQPLSNKQHQQTTQKHLLQFIP